VPGGPKGFSPRWFRGWVMVGAGFVVLFVVYGLQFSYGEFRLAATEEEGWSQSSLSLIFAIYIGGYSALSAVSGWATDRVGPRLTVACGSVLLCLGYGLWARAESLVGVAVALAVIAPIGMSCSWVPVNATAVRWFVRRRGTATAIVTSGGSFGNIVGPPAAAWLIGAYGWRSALTTMAAIGLVLLLGAAAVLVKGPETVGLHPDGAAEPPAGEAGEVSLTPSQAGRTGTFWIMWAMYSVTFLVVFVPFVHGSAFAVGLGIPKLSAATVISAIGIGGLTGRLLVGWLSDRIDRRRAALLALGLQVLAFLGFASANGLAMLYPAAVAFGFGYGGAVAVFPALVADYFGRANAGAIVGRMFASAGTMAAVGPYVAALIFDATGSYRSAFAIAAGLNGLAAVLAARLPATGMLLTPNRSSMPGERLGPGGPNLRSTAAASTKYGDQDA
jgi:MFS family permease